ncbi:MAG: triose-phosphate isomerase [Patescibacteria group bacterium]
MKKLLIANWKMNPKSIAAAQALFELVKKAVKTVKSVQVVICPPAVFLPILVASVSARKSSGGLAFGSQNCHWETQGAFTGEISATMLAQAGAEYVILGHSERRQFMGETDEIINLKIKTALKAKLKPVFCVGEKSGEELSAILEEQLTRGLAGLSVKQMAEVIIAYEPAWAIGSGNPCLPDSALSASLFIRKILTKLYSRFLAEQTSILYGGSVAVGQDAVYLKQSAMNGLLVGGVSLDADEFIQIIKNVDF